MPAEALELLQLLREDFSDMRQTIQALQTENQFLTEEVAKLRKESTLRRVKRVREEADQFAMPKPKSQMQKFMMAMAMMGAFE